MSHLQTSARIVALIATLVTLPLLSSVPARGACDVCKNEVETIKKAAKNLKAFEDLKKRNEDFLKSPAAQDPSKAIKVKSNILICMVKIDTEKNNVFGLKQELTKKSCTDCSELPKDLPPDPAPSPGAPVGTPDSKPAGSP